MLPADWRWLVGWLAEGYHWRRGVYQSPKCAAGQFFFLLVLCVSGGGGGGGARGRRGVCVLMSCMAVAVCRTGGCGGGGSIGIVPLSHYHALFAGFFLPPCLRVFFSIVFSRQKL